jgi:two-component system NtrC family sensor kinase
VAFLFFDKSLIISPAFSATTDINKMSDEYLRLAYHGLGAKDKSFYATIQTDQDESTGKINIIRQEIGSVLLNLYNHAFYKVTEKKKQ